MHNRVLFFGPRIIQFSKPNNGLVIWISWSPAETILFILEHCSTKSGRFWFLKIFSWNEKICWSVKNLNVIVANNNSFNTFTLFHNTVTQILRRIYCRLNSEKFENCHFWGKNHKNDNSGEFPDFYECTLYIIFEIFHGNSLYRNDHFQKKRENHRWIRKNPGYHFYVFPKNGEFR